MTDTGQDPEAGGAWAEVDDAALARAMRPSADDQTYAAAWREFESRHLGHIKAFIDGRGRELGFDGCDELLQLTMLRIQEKVEQFVPRGPRSFRSWCFKIAENLLGDAWRGRLPLIYDAAPGAPVLVPFDEIAERYAEDLVTGEGDEAKAITVAIPDTELLPRSERDQALWEAFDSLTEVDRAVLWCRIVHDDSDERVAEIVGKPADHVRKILYKAVKKLGREFEKRLAKRRQAS